MKTTTWPQGLLFVAALLSAAAVSQADINITAEPNVILHVGYSENHVRHEEWENDWGEWGYSIPYTQDLQPYETLHRLDSFDEWWTNGRYNWESTVWQVDWVEVEVIEDDPPPPTGGNSWTDLIPSLQAALSTYRWDLSASPDFTTFLRDSKGDFHRTMGQKMREGKARVMTSSMEGPLNADEAAEATRQAKQVADIERYAIATGSAIATAALTRSATVTAAVGAATYVITSGIEGQEFREGDYVLRTAYIMDVSESGGWREDEMTTAIVYEFMVLRAGPYFAIVDEVGNWMNNAEVAGSMTQVMDNPRLAEAIGIRIFRGADGKVRIELLFPPPPPQPDE